MTFLIFHICAVLIFGLTTGSDNQQMQNHFAEGNLAPTQNPGCISAEHASDTLTPADLSLGAVVCSEQEDIHKMAEMYILMHLRGSFDAKRVADKTARPAILILSMNVDQALSQDVLMNLQLEVEKILDVGSSCHASFCAHMIAMDLPNYFPIYMIQHGIQAFSKAQRKPFVDDFNAGKAWQEVLDSQLKCV